MSRNRAARPRRDVIGLREIRLRRITAMADTARVPTADPQTTGARITRVHLAHVRPDEPTQNGAVQ
ncbi:hypothetical protein OHT57_07240 [Streptomyces sp. NBC_00285]|uniref:hypothetical protein n=1 Tax=Streptomyces sp. NBC_00285 TaxID=2975700 RepID=UPI002E2BDE6F|nr:hypothetical protein [Streptomyces sp. NBC_00285]